MNDTANTFAKIIDALKIVNCKAEHASQDDLSKEEAIAISLRKFGVDLNSECDSPFTQLANMQIAGNDLHITASWEGVAGTRRFLTLARQSPRRTGSNLGSISVELDSDFSLFENEWQYHYLHEHIRADIQNQVNLEKLR